MYKQMFGGLDMLWLHSQIIDLFAAVDPVGIDNCIQVAVNYHKNSYETR